MGRVMRFDFARDKGFVFDFTDKNPDLFTLDLNHETAFTEYIFAHVKKANEHFGIGRYNENRVLYSRSEVFGGDRSVHLGIDIWAPAGEEVFAPWDATIHSFKNNASHGDYGPTIILEHSLEEHTFYTLYGHLSIASLEGKQVGQVIRKGEKFASLGEYHENVHWPPHFQVITDMMGYVGDFPGVAAPEKLEEFLSLCPDPNLILGLHILDDNKV